MATSSFVEVWGIPTCGTVKKTLKHLQSLGIPHEFKDFRKTPPTKVLLANALASVSAPKQMFNTSGASYREGGWRVRADGMSSEQVVEALLADPMLIKRPIIRTPKGTLVGFNEEALRTLL
jgi:arsenate reductase (glutaredoxin)